MDSKHFLNKHIWLRSCGYISNLNDHGLKFKCHVFFALKTSLYRLNDWRHRIIDINRKVFMLDKWFVKPFYYRKLLGINISDMEDENSFKYG